MVARAPLFAAPHRLLFLTGAFQLAAVLAWWSATLLDLQGIGLNLPQAVPAILLHAPILLFLVLPPFFFGFLLTTFPRWLGFPDSTAPVYLPVGTAFAAAIVALPQSSCGSACSTLHRTAFPSPSFLAAQAGYGRWPGCCALPFSN